MFELCCESRITKPISLVHSPKPISFSNDMDQIIKEVLWYVPNIDSHQSSKNELIGDKVYSDFSFTYILNKMGMSEDRDVKWIDNSTTIDDADWMFFENEICTNCQKAIIVRLKKLSKTNDFLRCIRNCVAHGHFTVVDDYLIGFNLQKTEKNPDGIKKAVIKIKPEALLDALEELMSPRAKESLVGYALERVGYTVQYENARPRDGSNGMFYDILAEKNGVRYAIEIKDYKGSSYVHLDSIYRFLSSSESLVPDLERVFMIDTSRVTKDVKEWAERIDHFRIVDMRDVRQLLADDPVDILQEHR